MTKRGRPPGTTKSFLADPDRFAVAFADMLQLGGMTENKALHLTTAFFFGRKVDPTEAMESAKTQERVGEGWEVVSYEVQSTTLKGKVESLRQKSTKATSPLDIKWRSTVCGAFWLAFFRQDLPFAALRDLIRMTCASAGERELPEVLLQIMISPKNMPPELFQGVFAARNVIDGRPTLLQSPEATLGSSPSRRPTDP